MRQAGDAFLREPGFKIKNLEFAEKKIQLFVFVFLKFPSFLLFFGGGEAKVAVFPRMWRVNAPEAAVLGGTQE